MSYFQLSASWRIVPAKKADVIESASTCITDANDLDSVDGLGPTGEARLGYFEVSPVLHPWLASDFSAVCGLPLATLERMMFGGIAVIERSPTSTLPAGTLVRSGEVGALVERHGTELEVSTGPSAMRALARLSSLTTCKARLDRLADGEALDSFSRLSDHERSVLVDAGRRVLAKLDACGLTPADMFLGAIPVAPLSFRSVDASRGQHPNARATLRSVFTQEQRRTRLPPISFSSDLSLIVVDQENAVQEGVFELFTAGTICMAASAGLIDDDLATDFMTDMLSEAPEDDDDDEPEKKGISTKEDMLRAIFDDRPNPRIRRPRDLFIWARRAGLSFQLIALHFEATHGEPSATWMALLRSAGLAVSR